MLRPNVIVPWPTRNRRVGACAAGRRRLRASSSVLRRFALLPRTRWRRLAGGPGRLGRATARPMSASKRESSLSPFRPSEPSPGAGRGPASVVRGDRRSPGPWGRRDDCRGRRERDSNAVCDVGRMGRGLPGRRLLAAAGAALYLVSVLVGPPRGRRSPGSDVEGLGENAAGGSSGRDSQVVRRDRRSHDARALRP